MKARLTLFAIMIAIGASAHNFTVTKGNFKQNAGQGKSANLTMTTTRTDSLYYQIQTAGDSLFSVLPGFTSTFAGKNWGTHLRTIVIPDSSLSWARIISWDSLGNRDTTGPIKMFRKPKVYATAYALPTKIWSNVTVDNGNDSVLTKFILGYDSIFSSTYMYRTQLVVGNSVVIFPDTVSGLATATDYWIKIIVPNVIASDTFIFKKKTLSNSALPYVAIDGPLTSTNATMTLQAKVDGFGYPTTAVGFIKKKGATSYQDSISLPVVTMLGKQSLVFTFTGLSATTDYLMDVRVTNQAGSNWMGQVLYQTGWNPPTHFIKKDSVSATDSGIYIRYVYSNVPNNTCDLTIVCDYGSIGSPFSSYAFHNLLYTGSKEYSFAITQKGDYYLYAYSPDYPSGTIAYSDTVHIKVMPTGITTVSYHPTVQVYPNPATNLLFITGAKNYSLIDMFGKKVQAGIVPASNQISISDLPKGIYILQADDVYEKIHIQ